MISEKFLLQIKMKYMYTIMGIYDCILWLNYLNVLKLYHTQSIINLNLYIYCTIKI